ncbi:hypothetical protein DIPPA_33658 [Diplonema papillatum]|nr:hypothetical protein DIPPA_33658 [Diplonema papillatum]
MRPHRWVLVSLAAVVLALGGAAGQDVVEGLLFEDEDCRTPLGRIVLKATEKCECMKCARWDRTEGEVTLTPVTPTLTETLETQTLTITPTEFDDAPPQDNFTTFEVFNSSRIGYRALLATGRSQFCGNCSLSTFAMGRATCLYETDAQELAPAVNFTLFEEGDFCVGNGTAGGQNNTVAIVIDACVRVPAADAYILFSRSTCQRIVDDDDDWPALKIVVLVAVCVGGVVALIVCGVVCVVHKQTRAWEQLQADVDGLKSEQKQLRETADKVKMNVEEQQRTIGKVAREVDMVAGNSKFTSGVALSAAPPALPLRDELEVLAAYMGNIEGKLHVQRSMERDAML